MSSSSESSDSYLGGGDEDEREYDAFDYEEECASEDDGERFIREGQLVQPRPRSPKKSLIKAFTDLVEKGYQVASPSSKDAEVLSKKLGVSSEKFDKLNLYRKVNPELAKLFANECMLCSEITTFRLKVSTDTSIAE